MVANDTLFNDTITYIVYVQNVRQRSPKWVTSPAVYQGEEKEVHTVQFKAIDGDTGLNDEIAYGLTFKSSDDEPYFSMNSSTGLLTIGYIDRDILASDYFGFNVLAYKKLYPVYNTSLAMTVIVLDIDDHTPSFTIEPDKKEFLEIHIDEKSTTLQLNDTIYVKDPDLGANGTFSIKLINDPDYNNSVDWSENFLVVPASGYQSVELTLAVRNGTKLDYEDPDWRDIYMQIIAQERFNTSHINSTNFIVHLNDINDEYPIFDKSEYNASLREDADVGDFVITCHATDADFNYTDPVTHILLPQSQKALVIDPTSGNITVAKENPYNYQQQQEVFLQVLAEDSNTPEPHRTYAQLTVNIIDVNNEPPVITLPDTGSQPEVVENATSGDVVVTVTATDPDTGADLVFSIDWDKTYASKLGVALTGDSKKYYENCFYIDTVSNDNSTRNVRGVVRVTKRNVFPTKNMDWGKFDTVFLTIKVTDLTTEPKFIEKNQNRSTLLTVVIVDVNDNPPIFEDESYTASVTENTKPDTLITSVTATDADGPGNNNVTYYLTLVSTSLNATITKYYEFVTVDPISGKIFTGSFNIDCEVYQFFIYNITATDGVFNTVATMNLTVIDQNDNVPQINNSLPDVHIDELTGNGTLVKTIHSYDIDYSVPYHTCYYLIEYTSDSTSQVRNFFSIDIDTGKLIVNLQGGLELNLVKTKTLSYLIPLMVRDNFKDRQTDPTVSNAVRSMITVYIDDINNNAPTFPVLPSGQYLFTCTTHDAPGTVVMKSLEAPDLDEPGPNSWVKYKILNVTIIEGKHVTAPADLFNIHNNDDNKTATITVARNLSDWWGVYEIAFYAQDEGEPPLNDTTIYRVRIEGFNDHDPVFTNPSANMTYLKVKREQKMVASCIIKSDGMCFPDIAATDEDEGDNGRVSFKILGDEYALQYLKMSADRDDNTGTLQMAQLFDSESPSIFKVMLEAYDHGNISRSTTTSFQVLVISQQPREPEYPDPIMEAQFTENVTGLSEYLLVRRPVDPDYNVSMVLQNWTDPIYYYLLDSTWDGMEHFQIDKETGNLTLKSMLDREKIDNYTLHILASKSETQPITIQSQKSILEVDIKVLDVYDTPPVFQQSLYTGGIKNGDSKGKVIFTVTATDEDLNDTTAFTIENSEASSDQLRKLLGDGPFTMDKDTGVLALSIDMDIANLQGYFHFDIRATDLGNNSNVVPGKVYIVADSNFITFQFNNPLTEVQEKKLNVISVFTKVFGWQCAIDDMSSGNTRAVASDFTNVKTHFVDLEKNQPIDASQIKLQLNVRSIISSLHNDFLAYSLEFSSFEDTAKAAASGNMEQVLQLVLIVVSVVLGTMVVVLFIAFFYRTRYLTRRLEALSETKFGSKDSGLNRIGMAMPNTNKHAVDGSNPVWRNEEITARDLDTASIGSGDSELIGIEDDPQFNPHMMDANERRPSFHPGINERRSNVNPIYSPEFTKDKKNEDDDSGIHDHTTMQLSNKNIPTTEL